MRILIATGIYPPDIGGPAQYAKNLEAVWTKQGHEVRVKFFEFERKLPSGLRHAWYFFKILPAVLGADFILVLDTFSVAIPAVCAARLFGKKVLLRTGGDFLWESYVERTGDLVLFRNFYKTSLGKLSAKERFVFNCTRWVLSSVDALIFSTAWQRDIFAEPYRLDLKKTYVVENYFGPKEPSFPPETKNFIAGTRPLKWKNSERLALAFAKVREKEETLVYDNTTAPFESFMEKLSHAYAVVLASLGDISPNLILDAIRHNKPFIVTRETGLYERIKECALFVDPENVDDIAEKIFWLSDSSHYEEQKRKVESFSFTHTWEQIAAEILELCQK